MSEFILPNLTNWYQKKYLAYAMQVLEAQQQMITPKGKNILHYTLYKKRKHKRYQHYPKDDRIDRNTGAQYFYHCHREDFDTTEHGHFHCFLRYKHIPQRIKPIPLADWDRYIDNPMTHLVAISMNQLGMPIRLFTVNRWVTSDIWYDAKHAPSFIRRFQMLTAPDPYWQPLDKWVDGILHLFLPQIAWLYLQRDRIMAQHQALHPEDNIYLKQDIEEISSIDIDLKQQIEWIIQK